MNRKLSKKLYNITTIFLTLAIVLCIISLKNQLIGLVSKNEFIFEPLVIYDAGHGGQDGGAVSSNGVSEAAINLCISQKSQMLSAFLGIPSSLTRADDNSLDFKSESTLKQNKMSDLKARVRMGKQNPKADYISIHLNKFSDKRYFGAQVFHKMDASSTLLAQNLQGSLYSIDERNTRVFKPIPNENYIMEHLPNVGVIVECGFLSNTEEELMLQNEVYQTKLALLIVSGYTNYKFNR